MERGDSKLRKKVDQASEKRDVAISRQRRVEKK